MQRIVDAAVDPSPLTINGRMITLARESRGLSQGELAAHLGVQQGTVSKWEMGLQRPTEELAEQLFDILHYPKTFFMQSGELMGLGIGELFHRKRQNVPQRTLARIYADIDIRARHVEVLLKSAEMEVTLPRFDIEQFEDKPEHVAQLVRATLGIPRGPIADLTRMVENAGVVVVPCDFPSQRVDAISCWAGSLPPMVFVNRHSPKDRYRFSLAHELGHLVMHSMPTADVEPQADRFSAELLMPAREIESDLRDLTADKLPQLKKFWRVSMAALIKRAGDLGAITANQARYLFQRLSKAGYRTREPAHLDVDGEEASLMYELIDVHRENLDYSVAELSHLLSLHEDEFCNKYVATGSGSSLRLVNRD